MRGSPQTYQTRCIAALISLDGIEVLSGAAGIVALAIGGECTPEAASWIEWAQTHAGNIVASCTCVGEKAGEFNCVAVLCV